MLGTDLIPRRRRRGRLGALRLVREASFPSPEEYCSHVWASSPQDVYGFMRPYVLREEVETLWVLALNLQHRVIFGRPIAVTRGILDSSLAHPREVFRIAIVANAAAIVVVHNHPSGDLRPSDADKALTAQLAESGKILDVPLFDHLIASALGYFSFAEKGLL